MAGSNGLNIAGNKFDAYKCDANEAIQFRIIRNEADLEDENKVFHPDMTHQLFGDSESIFGYKDLRVNIYCTSARMTKCVTIKYSDKVSPQQADGVAPDNIMKVLNEYLQPGYDTNLDEFQKKLLKDKSFVPYGEQIHAYTVTKEGQTHQYELYKASMLCPGFRDFHERIQPFLMFYVDGASYIDVDDERWDYYLLFEKYREEGREQYAFCGYMTVYNYFAYPARIRPRLSQVVVLPPYQRQGHGAVMLQTLYDACIRRPDVRDITVEDPSENFQRVRDFVDAKNCSALPAFQPESLHQGFSEEMVSEAQLKLKINKKQARRIYEILRLRATKPENYKEYRLDIKKRLNIPFQKNGRDFEKLRRALNPAELSATINNTSADQRLEYLQKMFEEVVDEYRRVLDRMASS